MMALLQVEYKAPKLRGFGRSSLIRTAQRSSIIEYCLSNMFSSPSEKVPSTGEVQYRFTIASKQMIAEHRVDVIIKAGDFSALPKERVVDLFPMSNVRFNGDSEHLTTRFEGVCRRSFREYNRIGLVKSAGKDAAQLLYLIFCNPKPSYRVI